MDRVGRLTSDIALHMSNLITNPQLYPKLLLGINNINFIDDNISCASEYSMYTNDGSMFSGIQSKSFKDHKETNDIQNQIKQSSNNTNTNINVNENKDNNDIVNNNICNMGNISMSNIDQTNNLNNENKLNNSILQETYFSQLPKINLQFPAISHMNFLNNAYSEPNFELFIRTVIPSTNLNGNIPSMNVPTQVIYLKIFIQIYSII